MKKLGLVGRMTLTTFVLFMLFMIFAFFFEGTYFGSFYLNQRVETISKQVDKFANTYRHSNWDNQELVDNMNLFNTMNGVELTVLDDYGNIKNDTVYEIVIETFDFLLHKNVL